jgi:predicted ATP-grasp superfamily ATP-dependent carboligase
MSNDLYVSFDSDMDLLAVSPSAWTAVGPERWFPNYHVISVIDNPLQQQLGIFDLRKYLDKNELVPLTVKEMFKSSVLKKMIKAENLQDYHYVLNRASSTTDTFKKLGNSHKIVSRFENKAWLRENFSDSLRFTPYIIETFKKLQKAKSYDRLREALSANLVIQHPTLAGGRGTFFVSNEKEYIRTMTSLSQFIESQGEKIVVSKWLSSPLERTLQCCVTNDEVLVGPPQAQLVRHPLLTLDEPGAIQFCGGRIHRGLLSDEQFKAAADTARIIGESLRSSGYRGIFGVDLLVQGSEVWFIEVNPRLTGLTPLLTSIQKNIPFRLLHILELASTPYTIKKPADLEAGSGSFVQIYSQSDGSLDLQTGLYDENLKKIGDGFESGTLLPLGNNEYFVALRVNPNEKVKKGKSLAFIYSKRQLFNDEGSLDTGLERLVECFRLRFTAS